MLIDKLKASFRLKRGIYLQTKQFQLLWALVHPSVFSTYPISSKCSLSTAQMVTHSVGVPVRAETSRH